MAQHKEIVYTVQYERENAVKWVDLLRGKTGNKGGTKTIRRLLLGAGTQAMQQLSGTPTDDKFLGAILTGVSQGSTSQATTYQLF